MFERGEDTGDTPGEFQLWVEREHLDQILPLPPAILPPFSGKGRRAQNPRILFTQRCESRHSQG
jgi:hypothetical protein